MKTLNKAVPIEATNPTAFSRTDLLALIGAVALLFIILPQIGKANPRIHLAQCATNLRQFSLGVQLSAADNNNRLPSSNAGAWPFDMGVATADLFMAYGVTRTNMYCPENPKQNNDTLWNFGSVRVIGYAMSFGLRVQITNSTLSLVSSLILNQTPSGLIIVPAGSPSRRVLLADVVISNGLDETNRTLNNYTSVDGGWKGHRTSHLQGAMPAGGNLAMLDGSVVWRSFDEMRIARTSGTPAFWW